MKYDIDELFKQACELTDKHKLLFVDDIIALLPCAKSTFYTKFPEGSDYLNKIKEIIDRNRVTLKVGLRKKWHDSDNATLQLALYKLLANPQELAALTNYRQDESENVPQAPISVNFVLKNKEDDGK
jgi:hypothetical protein